MQRPVIAIIQARTGSTRLPSKVLAPVLGRPLLEWMLERVSAARSLDRALVATTTEQRDDAVADVARRAGVEVFRGSEEDVLDRYVGAATQAGAGTVVRLTADCPLLDPAVVDRVVDAFAADGPVDLATNAPPIGRTFPDGMDVEVMSRAALERAAAEAQERSDREHVTRWLHRSGRFRVREVHLEPPRGEVRITVDTPADLELVHAAFAELHPRDPRFGMDDLLGWLDARDRR